MTGAVVIRDLRTLAEIREVMAMEREIWGDAAREDAVGLPIFVVTIAHGGLLLGACAGGQLVGFVYSLACLKDGRPIQWSHMMAVRAAWRGAGVGRALKLAQRERALAQGITVMEWTCDPLQAANAHLNFARLGVIVEEYHENVYGDSASPLHRGAPTDRFVAQWRLPSPRVSRLAASAEPAGSSDRRVSPDWPPIVEAGGRGGFAEPVRIALGRTDADLVAHIPGRFTDMLADDPGLAAAWRLATREVFAHYLARGYRVVDFVRGAAGQGGAYVVSRAVPADLEA